MSTFSAPAPLPAEQRLVLDGVDWQEYRLVLRGLNGRHVRITYDRGAMEIMTLSFPHESSAYLAGRFIDILCDELKLRVRAVRSTTLKRKKMKRGLESDNAYYIRNEPLIRRKPRIDLRIDPAPDLAVEVDITHSSLNRMRIYAALGVPEVWRYDGETLQVYLLGENRRYAQSQTSLSFPSIPVQEIASFLQRRAEEDDMTLAQEFRNWVRQLLAAQNNPTPPVEPTT